MPTPQSAAPRDTNQRVRLRSRLDAGCGEMGLSLSGEVSECLLDYIDLLVQWNAVYNLTAVREPEQMIVRHLLDSLSVAPFVVGKTLADLGSGAGLPGIPLAILMPERQFLLVDSNGKKARFLREAARSLRLSNVSVENARVENVRGQFDCITARAFASLADMLAWGGHLLAPDGCWLALKGQLPGAEMDALPQGFEVRAAKALRIPGLEADRHVIIVGRAPARAAS